MNGPGPLRGRGEISFWFHLESQSKNKKGRLRHCRAAARMYFHGLVKDTAVALSPGDPTTLMSCRSSLKMRPIRPLLLLQVQNPDVQAAPHTPRSEVVKVKPLLCTCQSEATQLDRAVSQGCQPRLAGCGWSQTEGQLPPVLSVVSALPTSHRRGLALRLPQASVLLRPPPRIPPKEARHARWQPTRRKSSFPATHQVHMRYEPFSAAPGHPTL